MKIALICATSLILSAAWTSSSKAQSPPACKLNQFQQCLMREAGGRLNPTTCTVNWVGQMMGARDQCKRKYPN